MRVLWQQMMFNFSFYQVFMVFEDKWVLMSDSQLFILGFIVLVRLLLFNPCIGLLLNLPNSWNKSKFYRNLYCLMA